MDADIVILETVEKVVRKHTAVRNPNYEEIVHNVSVELDQMELLHDIAKRPKKGYYHVRVTVGSVIPYFILLPKKAQQKLFTNLLKLQEA